MKKLNDDEMLDFYNKFKNKESEEIALEVETPEETEIDIQIDPKDLFNEVVYQKRLDSYPFLIFQYK